MRILLLEDDREAALVILKGMGDIGHTVRWVEDGNEAVSMMLESRFDVAIIDRMVPEPDGIAVVLRVRAAACNTPILMLTALGELEDRVSGLDAGADDYLAKPFAFVELVARINALDRRSHASDDAILVAGDIEMNLLRREVRRGTRRIDLQPREFHLLEELLRNADRAITKAMLLEIVWKFDFDPRTSVVETLISRLRTKLNEGCEVDAIQTVRGTGYMIRTDG